MVVVGGTDAAPYDEVHELLLDSLVWRVIAAGGTQPTPRWSHMMQYDGAENRLVVFGGQNIAGQMMNDVWTLDLTAGNEHWTQLSPSGSRPCARSTATSCYDPGTRTFYVFGGFEYPGYIALPNDLFALDLTSPAWTELRPSGTAPSERRGTAGLHDPYNRNLVLFAGQSYDDWENDTYYLGTGQPGVAEWQPAAPGGTGLLIVGPSVSARPGSVTALPSPAKSGRG